jgi:hypothetical protein
MNMATVKASDGTAIGKTTGTKRTRTKVDVTKLHPLDAKLHRMAQAHRIIKMADGLDGDTLALVVGELDKQLGAKAEDQPKAAE